MNENSKLTQYEVIVGFSKAEKGEQLSSKNFDRLSIIWKKLKKMLIKYLKTKTN